MKKIQLRKRRLIKTRFYFKEPHGCSYIIFYSFTYNCFKAGKNSIKEYITNKLIDAKKYVDQSPESETFLQQPPLVHNLPHYTTSIFLILYNLISMHQNFRRGRFFVKQLGFPQNGHKFKKPLSGSRP